LTSKTFHLVQTILDSPSSGSAAALLDELQRGAEIDELIPLLDPEIDPDASRKGLFVLSELGEHASPLSEYAVSFVSRDFSDHHLYYAADTVFQCRPLDSGAIAKCFEVFSGRNDFLAFRVSELYALSNDVDMASVAAAAEASGYSVKDALMVASELEAAPPSTPEETEGLLREADEGFETWILVAALIRAGKAPPAPFVDRFQSAIRTRRLLAERGRS
jgi:hypothetical protein